MATPFSLLTSDGRDCTSQPQLISLQGLGLQLNIVAGQELTASTTLTVEPIVNSDKTVELELLTAVISSDQGAFSKGKSVSWLMADWGVERPLSSLHIKLTPTQPKIECKARLKIFTNGHWLPLTPIDIFTVDSDQVFSAVMASKVMIELVTAGQYVGLWQPLSAAVDELTLKVSTAPADIELSLLGQTIGSKQIGSLPVLGFAFDDFANMINRYVQQNPDQLTVPLLLSAKTVGKVNIRFKPVSYNLIQQLPEQGDGKLNLYWQDEATQASAKTAIKLSKNTQLQELDFMVDYAPIAERLYFNSLPTPNRKAHTPNERAAVAQGFQTDADGINLAGFDLRLEKRSEALTATLALHPDQHGYPADQPYGGVVLAIDETSLWQNDWLSLTFPRPIHLSDAKWWLVLTVQQGDAFWWFADNPPEPVGETMYQMDGGAWLACAEMQWLQTRVRLLNPDTINLTRIDVQRGKAKVSLTQQKTFFTATPDALAILNNDTNALVTLEVIAQASGTLTFSKLRITYL